jgi:hypothetical protein
VAAGGIVGRKAGRHGRLLRTGHAVHR